MGIVVELSSLSSSLSSSYDESLSSSSAAAAALLRLVRRRLRLSTIAAGLTGGIERD
jgi:hypothetical protein